MALEHITMDNFKDFINQDEIVLVDFWAVWCGPCRILAPVLEQLNSVTSLKIGKVNVDEESDIAAAFSIRSIPTLIAFKAGRVLDKKEGYMPMEMINNWIESLK